MSEPTQSNLDRTSEWGTRRQPVAPNLSGDTAPGISAGDQTSAFTSAEPIENQAADRAASPFSAPQAVTLPCDFGDYELLEEVAHGGMGVVYKARQKSLDRIIALKMILPHMVATPIAVKRFYQEARSAAQLEHPNIVPIYEIKELHGRHYFTMAFIEGSTLKARVADHILPRREILELFTPIVEAVAFAHDKGIIHRDLKPDNVLLDAQGRPRITDFGLAKPTSGSAELTSTGQILGTPAYMAPEQALGGDRKIGPEADVYALGSILYFLLTGEPPFGGKSVTEILFRVVNEPVPAAPPRVGGDLADLDSICRKCLEKSPSSRYPDGKALLAALREVPVDRLATPEEMVGILAPVGARRVDPERLIAKPQPAPKKNRTAAMVAAGFVASLALVAGGVWMYLNQTSGSTAVASSISPDLIAPIFDKNELDLKVKMNGMWKAPVGEVMQFKEGGIRPTFEITSDKKAYFAVWAVNEDNTVQQVFPNKYEWDNELEPNVTRTLGKGKGWDFNPTAAHGTEYIRIVASTKPIDVRSDGENDGAFWLYSKDKSKEFVSTLRGMGIRKTPEQFTGEVLVPFHVSGK
jgi:tRNA A-37 threonylcarbamoyl transferase component Bud32